MLTTGQGVVNGLGFQVAAPAALDDKKKAAAIKDYLERLRRAQNWVFKHPEAWAKVWAKETGLPYEVALDAVKRTNGDPGHGRRRQGRHRLRAADRRHVRRR